MLALSEHSLRGALPQAYFTPVVLVIMVTTLVTPPLISSFLSWSSQLTNARE
ncbi:hypothetical protein ABEW34_23180 [Paenibacillus algorifonticola]|uniref:hypothetical protein n=1 Tax=Paenibacillus algorifonticola TaxID=684063 RepID=UPI003D2D63C8